jgi:7-keto-8-aminopelargonate synthetase-like enzyme
MYPTVRLGQAMIRLAVSSSHSGEEIRGVAEVLNMVTDRQDGRVHG